MRVPDLGLPLCARALTVRLHRPWELGLITNCSGQCDRVKTDDCAGELLPSGICLPSPWPPRRPLTHDPPPEPPYIEKPPAVIDIKGRQLFVDDFVIANRVGTQRTFHQVS